MKHKTLLFLYLILCGFYGCSLDDSVLSHSSIQGVVKDTSKKPLAGVTVELIMSNGNQLVQTDQSGQYQLTNVPYGLATLKYSYGDYYEVSKKLTISNTETNVIDVTLRNFLDDYYLSCTAEYISLQNIDTGSSFKINTNAGFTIDCEATWLTITPKQAPGNSEITLTCEPNNNPTLLETEIIIIGDYGLEKRVTVTQQPGPILATEGIDNPSYLPKVNKEGIQLHFSRPIEFVSVYKKSDKTQVTVEHESLNNGLTIKLRGFSQPILETTTYILTVKSTDGISIDTEFQIHSYLKKFETNYWNSILFMPGDDVFWQRGDTYTLHKVENNQLLTTLSDKHTYSHIVFTSNQMIGFRKKHNGDFFADFYESNTGKHLFEKKIELNPQYELPSVTILNNGKALLHCGTALFLWDTTLPQLQPVQLNIDGIESPDSWNIIPNLVMSAGGGNSFYLYHKYHYSFYSKVLYRIDASTLQINKVDLPADDWSIGRGLQSPYLIFSWNNQILLINTENQNQITIPASMKYSRIVPIEKEGTLTHLILSNYNTLYIANVETKQIRPLVGNDIQMDILSESYTSNYQLIYHYNGTPSSYYIFETDLLISATIQP